MTSHKQKKSSPVITKQLFLNAIVCRTRSWRLYRENEVEANEGDRFRLWQGIEIGKRARNLFKGGKLADDGNTIDEIQHTQKLMDDVSVPAIFEGTFQIEGYITKADVLKRTEGGWHLYEVKSKTKIDASMVDDVAYTAMVLKRAEVPIVRTTLLTISTDFRLGMSDVDLFGEFDITSEVIERVDEFQLHWQEIFATMLSGEAPDPTLIIDCKRCEFFQNCTGSGITHHIFDIPRLHRTKFDKLVRLGITAIRDIPDDFQLTDRQALVHECVKTEKPIVRKELGKELAAISSPIHYLDFETVATAIPLYENVAPYEQVVTQFSVHTLGRSNKSLSHSDYIAEPKTDCRAQLAKKLISALHGFGSIIVYSGFEAKIIKSLARIVPDLSNDLLALLDRIVDLEKIISNNYSHPEFHGRTSIKITLPVLVENVSYDDLTIQDGDTAMAVFAKMAMGTSQKFRDEEMKTALRTYCCRDTFAMVKLHEKLATLC